MKILNVTQGESDWLEARRGVVTASEVDALVTPLFAIRKSEGVETYLIEKLSERLGFAITVDPTWEMQQGALREKIALPWYEFTYGVKVQRVGFCLSDDKKTGCSPDGLLGDDEGLEVKCGQPPFHLRVLLSGQVPPQYRAQIQFSLYVSGRKRWQFLSYQKSLPPVVITVERDPEAQAALKAALDAFLARLDAAEAKVLAMQAAEARGRA